MTFISVFISIPRAAEEEYLLCGPSLLYFPAVIVLVRSAWVRVSGEIIRVGIAIAELSRNCGRPDILQREILRVVCQSVIGLVLRDFQPLLIRQNIFQLGRAFACECGRGLGVKRRDPLEHGILPDRSHS